MSAESWLAEKKAGFPAEAGEPGAKRQRLDRDQLAIERAMNLPKPARYGINPTQKALDKFLRDSAVYFHSIPVTFHEEKMQVTFAGQLLDGTPATE